MRRQDMADLRIDGSQGEGGGQILRTALGLSCCTGRSFHIANIRANRRRPGLRPQHLAAVRAAAAVSRAVVQGDTRDSRELTFTPGRVEPGHYRFAVGTAGSTSLVLQTVLPALSLAHGPSELVLEGGTHNPMAPPFEFLQRVFLPLLNRMGPRVAARLERPGFAPRGGGCVRVSIRPCDRLRPWVLSERGAIVAQQALVLLAHLPQHIAERELAVVRRALGYGDAQQRTARMDQACGPGNLVHVFIESERITECFTAFGRRGRAAERVAEAVVREVRDYLGANVPVGRHLADQLLLPLALAGGGAFNTLSPSRHASTNIAVIRAFLPCKFELRQLAEAAWQIRVTRKKAD